MDVLGLQEHQFVIPVQSHVTINGAVYDGAQFVCRLLTLSEIKLIDKYTPVINDILHEGKEYDMEDDWFHIDRDAVEQSKLVAEEEVFKRCCIGVAGVEVTIQFDEIEAGVVTMIAQAILRRSLDMYMDFGKYIEIFYGRKSTYFDIIKSLLCRYQNEKMDDLDNMPIDKLLRRFAMLQSAFPEETKIKSKESDE